MNENVLAWEGGSPRAAYGGPVVETLEAIRLNNTGMEYLEGLRGRFASVPLVVSARNNETYVAALRTGVHEKSSGHPSQ
jgi:hypothetical protein